MPFEESSGYCWHCQCHVLIRRQGINHVLHLPIFLFLCPGLWAIPWAIICMRAGGWRCTRCGLVVGQREWNPAILALLVMILLGVLGSAAVYVANLSRETSQGQALPGDRKQVDIPAAPAEQRAAKVLPAWRANHRPEWVNRPVKPDFQVWVALCEGIIEDRLSSRRWHRLDVERNTLWLREEVWRATLEEKDGLAQWGQDADGLPEIQAGPLASLLSIWLGAKGFGEEPDSGASFQVRALEDGKVLASFRVRGKLAEVHARILDRLRKSGDDAKVQPESPAQPLPLDPEAKNPEEAKRRAERKAQAEAEAKAKNETAERKAEQTAATKLKLIKQLIENDKIETAKIRLEQLIKDYPKTKAAEEARKLLKELP